MMRVGQFLLGRCKKPKEDSQLFPSMSLRALPPIYLSGGHRSIFGYAYDILSYLMVSFDPWWTPIFFLYRIYLPGLTGVIIHPFIKVY